MNVELYDESNIDELVWPQTEEAKRAQAFFLPLIKEGTHLYIKNVNTHLKLLKLNEYIIPITVSEEDFNDSYVVSLYSIVGLLEEKIAKNKHWLNPLLKVGIKGIGFVLRSIRVNKAIYINNWLFSTSLNPAFSVSQIKAITQFLEKKFHDYMIVFRSVNSYSDGQLIEALKEQKYHMVKTREVFIYDPKSHNVWSKRDCKRDWRLLMESGYEVIEGNQFQSEDGLRGLDLYRSLYIDKYTKYSPEFTEKFIELLLRNEFLELRAIKKDGKIDGIAGYLKIYNMMIIPFFGYDLSQSMDLGLYRMINILGIHEARKESYILNQGSGAEAFKRVRGLVPHQEFAALGVKHLSGFRKIFWMSIYFFSQYILLPIHKKFAA